MRKNPERRHYSVSSIMLLSASPTNFQETKESIGDGWGPILEHGLMSTMEGPPVKLKSRGPFLQCASMVSFTPMSSHSFVNLETDVLLFHIASQNAALLLRKTKKDNVQGTIFECFEVSPKTEAVIASQHALRRTFPAQSVFVPVQTMQDTKFLEALSSAIQKMSIEQVAIAMEHSSKSGQSLTEERQSIHPKLVSEWLFGILAAEGTPVYTKTISKRTHDDVCFKSAARPWRRSPLWLSLRVALQICLANSDLADNSDSQYKNFVLYLLTLLSRTIVRHIQAPDTLHIVRVKLARRAAKLGNDTRDFVLRSVSALLEELERLLVDGWREIQSADAVQLPFVPTEQPELGLTLRNSAPKLKLICQRSRRPFTYPSTAFKPTRSTRCTLAEKDLPLSTIFTNVVDDGLLVLTAFETWIARHLSGWAQNQARDGADCTRIKGLVKAYYDFASTKYKGNAEQTSVMLLVIFELWIALDQIAVNVLPLLRDYSPEIPETLLTPLLLPKLRELERLHNIEEHLHERHSKCKIENPSIFVATSVNGFALRFFDSSANLQDLRRRVEADATKARDHKRRQWEEMKKMFDKMIESMEAMVCDQFTPRYGRSAGRPRHDRNCRKCKKKKEANELSISKHEWPLPSGENPCKAAIFELDPPEAFLAWRDTTWMILQDIARTTPRLGNRPQGYLLEYVPLAPHRRHTGRRVAFASSTKSFLKAHYFKSRLSLDDVFVSHGMQYRLFDTSELAVWVDEQNSQLSLSPLCTSDLPVGPYTALVKEVNFISHSQNEVLASQSKCSPEMSIHEWVSFGDIRADENLQWQKFLRELLSSNISFNATPVIVLLQQFGWQAGTSIPDTVLRATHFDFADQSFCLTLLETLDKCFGRIKANWKEMTSASGLLLIAHRVLSLNNDRSVTAITLKLIRMIKRAALEWMSQTATELGERCRSGKVCETGSEERLRVLEAALLVRSTWNVEDQHLSTLFGSPEDVADYIESSIYAHDYRSQFESTKDPKLRADLFRDKMLAIRLESHIREFLLRHNEALSKGIKRFWAVSGFAHDWTVIHGVDQSWLVNGTQNNDCEVHYNLISGELLVAGKPLATLPKAYTESRQYQTIFGASVLEVFQADVVDMEYMTARSVSGHQIYFGMRDRELVIRSKIGEDSFEAIPRECFLGDLLTLLVNETTPWMKLRNNIVEFRRNEAPWHADAETWLLFFNEDRPSTSIMRRQDRYFIDPSSSVGRTVGQIFRNFELPEHLLVSWVNNCRLEVSLPRYRLNFYMSWSGDLECRELSAKIDKDQKIGTLHGFESKLVLRASSADLKRLVLIPYGTLIITTNHSHITAKVHTSDEAALPFYQYKIDPRLGQLQAEGNLEAHLYKAYLHAVTSSVLPDTLTGRTGTEESLLCLSDSITKTSVPLTSRAQDILKIIAQLTPIRSYYPAHLKKMQTITWNNILSPLAQHDRFVISVADIASHNDNANFLYEGETTSRLMYQGDLHLLRRAQFRHAKLYPRQTADWPQILVKDAVYVSRDQERSDLQKRAFEIATLIKAWPDQMPVNTELYSVFKTWRNISGFDKTFSLSTFSHLLSFGVQENWASMYNLCRSSTLADTFKLIFKLSLIAFGNPLHLPHLRTLLAFTFHNGLKSSQTPTHSSYDLSGGDCVNQTTISAIISSCTEEFVSSSDESESGSDHEEDRNRFNREVKKQTELIRTAVNNSWPATRPCLPQYHLLTHFDVPLLEDLLTARFGEWYKNWTFQQRCGEFEIILRSINTSPVQHRMPDLVVPPRSAQARNLAHVHLTLLDVMLQSNNSSLLEFGHAPSGIDGRLQDRMALSQKIVDGGAQAQKTTKELNGLLDDLLEDSDVSVRAYARSLSESIDALNEKAAANSPLYEPPGCTLLENNRDSLKQKVNSMVADISRMLGPRTHGEHALQKVGLWPQVNTFALLELLSSRYRRYVPRRWAEILIRFGKELVALQRVERMMRYLESRDSFALRREVENEAHDAWDISAHPEWLLLEVQNDLLIRPVQVHVAEAMLQPKNGVLLLGMGEGKTVSTHSLILICGLT